MEKLAYILNVDKERLIKDFPEIQKISNGNYQIIENHFKDNYDDFYDFAKFCDGKLGMPYQLRESLKSYFNNKATSKLKDKIKSTDFCDEEESENNEVKEYKLDCTELTNVYENQTALLQDIFNDIAVKLEKIEQNTIPLPPPEINVEEVVFQFIKNNKKKIRLYILLYIALIILSFVLGGVLI